MRETRQRVVLGLGAAVAAVGAAAMVSAAATPVAHADADATVLADITTVEGLAMTAFTTGSADIASGDPAVGYTQLFTGLDDDLVNIPNLLQTGLLDELKGVPFTQSLSNFEVSAMSPFDFATPTLTGYVTEANTIYTEGATTLLSTITGLPATDYADTAMYNTLSMLDQFILPGQVEAIAALAFGV